MPTVTIGENTGDDYSGSTECWLKETSDPFPRNNQIVTGIWDSDIDEKVSLVSFSGISNLPSTLTVSSATFYLYSLTGASGANAILDVHVCLRNWVGAEAAWSLYSSGNSWTTDGARSTGNDRVAAVSVDKTVNTTINEYKNFGSATLAADVEDFADGTLSNYGWAIDPQPDSSTYTERLFAASTDTDGQRPYLSVTYTTGGGGATGKSNPLMGSFGGCLSGAIA